MYVQHLSLNLVECLSECGSFGQTLHVLHACLAFWVSGFWFYGVCTAFALGIAIMSHIFGVGGFGFAVYVRQVSWQLCFVFAFWVWGILFHWCIFDSCHSAQFSPKALVGPHVDALSKLQVRTHTHMHQTFFPHLSTEGRHQGRPVCGVLPPLPATLSDGKCNSILKRKSNRIRNRICSSNRNRDRASPCHSRRCSHRQSVRSRSNRRSRAHARCRTRGGSRRNISISICNNRSSFFRSRSRRSTRGSSRHSCGSGSGNGGSGGSSTIDISGGRRRRRIV